MQLHPIMYVPDQYAERSFYLTLGFETRYEGAEFPGFLAVASGDAILGLQRASADHPAYTHGLRWQFEVDTSDDLDDVISACQRHGYEHAVEMETGGDSFRTRLLTVVSPAGVAVVFEGPNELA